MVLAFGVVPILFPAAAQTHPKGETMKRLGIVLCFITAMIAAPSLEAQCPPGLPPGTTCVPGQDIHGAFFLMAVPANYNHRLVLWNHGYTLAPPAPLKAEDLGPAAALLQLGFAAAASSYRPDAIGLGGWAVRDGAEDTENLRHQFVGIFGRPHLTFVVGASEGGLITAEIAERFGRDEDGELNYNGSLPLCGPLAGGRRNWYGGFDLRVTYQYYCQNLPRPNELQYPLYLGLAPNNTLTLNAVFARVNECTGILQPPATRTASQAQNLANILGVTKIPESFLLTDMSFATFALQELVLVRTQGLSPVTNLGVQYQGSSDDAALNAGVFRAGANDAAAEFLESAYDPNGRIPMPTLTTHTIGDGLVIVENENAYRETVEDAHRRRRLQQNYVNANGHCQFTNSEVLASFQALVGWVETHKRPTREEVADLCQKNTAIFGDTCNFNLEFQPKPFDTRVPNRGPDE
jgi:hypothetical protein